MYCPVTLYYSNNCVEKNAEKFSEYGEKFLIVSGKSSAIKSGIISDLEKCNINFEIFDKIEPNPLISTCYEAGKIAREGGFDCIIGAGGGSAMDAAKAVAIYATNPEMNPEDIYNRKGCRRCLPVICIGSTAGTGSEVTGVSVLTNHKNGRKQSISGSDCYAAAAFCDWKYTKSMSREVTISTCLDAFAHAVESYLAVNSDIFSKNYAEKAIRLLYPVLKFLDTNAEITDEIRENQYLGSLFAGLAINCTGCLFPHTLGYALTEMFGIPHGRACTAFHPYLVKKAENYAKNSICSIYEFCDTDKESYLDLIQKLTDVKIPMQRDEILRLAERWSMGNKNFNKTPGGLDMEDIIAVFSELSTK